LQMMIQRGFVFHPFKVEGWYDCGKFETLLETNREILAQQKNGKDHHDPEHPNCIINEPVSIHPTAMVENSIIGPYVTVASGAVIRNSVIEDSIISRNASVSNIHLDKSIVSDNARVSSHPYRLNVGDSSELSLG